MRVEIPKREGVIFEEIKIGQCFIFNEVLYMKIAEVDGFNCVCLNTGIVDVFSDDDYVESAPAHVVVEY